MLADPVTAFAEGLREDAGMTVETGTLMNRNLRAIGRDVAMVLNAF